MSGWIKGPGGVFKRLQGLYVRLASAAPPSPFTLRPTFASMQFAAIYQAAWAGLTEMGGTFDAATAGPNATLSDGDLTVSFAGTGAVQGTIDIGTPGVPIAFEILVGATLTAIGLRSLFIFGFDGTQNYGGPVPVSQFLNTDGTWSGFDNPPAVPALVPGDVVGVVIDTGTNAFQFFVNGVSAAVGGLGAAGNPYSACVSAA